ncbi:hypothetical protein F4553_001656 [Allocatelliglobosispora scoriae]|uniref:Uncharacterized protein n=1 Tax=Allocatelliglobosispora scoriae TaxID=643052 RepID=A0A841BGR7_9ACTN|nr:hypothetical protein [Allocatelliglobosispora scoriae]MBB5868277.1 hypothetical protein [Allocatelliglobosispora scoriae]
MSRSHRPCSPPTGGRLPGGPVTWRRGRGWSLWKTLVTCSYSLGEFDAEDVAARHALDEIFTEYAAHRR